MESLMPDLPATNLTMLTEVRSEGVLELFLDKLPMPDVKPHEVLVQVEAAPINPSDLGLMFGPVDTSVATQSSRNGMPSITVPVSAPGMRAMAGRMGEALPIGNEGCGTVVAAGANPEAQALLGKRVALLGGAVYAEYRALPAMMCMPLPDGTSPSDGASCFVNPLTALSFTETMKLEGHSAIIHTAAASNLGQMLVKICKADGIPLINIVRSDAQVAILKGIGATQILNSTADDFQAQLVAAITETGATIAFDAIGGGKLPSQILSAMEVAAVNRMKDYSRYGSDTFKQIYLYGMLDPSPTTLNRSFGFNWACSGWLLTPWLGKLGTEISNKMRARIVAELTTTFASHYSHEVTLEQSLDLATAQAYNAKRTGEKYLIRL
jgi:NADPH:quinone reductase